MFLLGQTFIEQQVGDVVVDGRGQLNTDRAGRVRRVQRPGQRPVVINVSTQTGHLSRQVVSHTGHVSSHQ